MARGSRRKRGDGEQRAHRPHELGPRIEYRGASPWATCDLRPWGGGRYTAVRDPSHPLWPAAGDRTPDEDVAREWSWAYVRAYQDERRRAHLGQARVVPFPQAEKEWLAHRKRHQAANTYSSSVTAISHLAEWKRAPKSTADLSPELFQALFDELVDLGYAATTLQTYRNTLAAFCDWCGFGRKNNPARLARLPEPDEPDPRAWSDDEMEEIRAAADKLDRLRRQRPPSARFAIETAWAMGPRQQELFALEGGRINPREKTIRITRQLVKDGHGFEALKGKRARTALVLPFWWEHHQPGEKGLLVCNRDGSVISARARVQTDLIQRTLDLAGLNEPGFGWHTLRHTYARLCLERYEISLEQLQLFLGHKSITVTQRIYGHLSEQVAVSQARGRAYREEGIRLLKSG